MYDHTNGNTKYIAIFPDISTFYTAKEFKWKKLADQFGRYTHIRSKQANVAF